MLNGDCVKVGLQLKERGGRLGGSVFKGESRPMGGFILAEILVLAGTAGDNGTAGEPYTSQCEVFWLDETPIGRHFVR